MKNEWSIQKEILYATQRWPIIFSYCIAGCLIGLLFSSLLPSPYRATRELYVGLNIQQLSNGQFVGELSQAPISNVDDYKNWQMSCLNSAIFTNEIIDETLSLLQEKDSRWNGVNEQELADSLHVYWRNAGKWRLVAENQDPLLAYQAITIWQIVVLEKINEAISESSQAIEMHQKNINFIQTETNKQELIYQIDHTIEKLSEMKNRISDLPDKQDIDETLRISLQTIIIQSNSIISSPNLISNEFPNINASKTEYMNWINSFIQLLESEKENTINEIDWLEEERQKILTTYNIVNKKSLGLSTDLVVDGILTNQQTPQKIRPTSLTILVGGFLGLIAWVFIQLLKISLSTKP